MSSYDIEHGDYLLFVGWDRPLDTFFATIEQLSATGMEEPEMLLGSEPGEYRDVEGFQQALNTVLAERGITDFALPGDLVQRLHQDYDENPPGTGQQAKTAEMRLLNQHWFQQDTGRDHN